MVVALIVAVYAVSGACFLDGARRSQGEWAHADKERSYWLMMIVVGGLLVLPAVVVVPAYLVGVVPKFAGARAAVERSPFSK